MASWLVVCKAQWTAGVVHPLGRKIQVHFIVSDHLATATATSLG
jgi:hypothetical protein